MKKVLVLVLLLLGTRSFSQVGVVTINEDDLVPVGQWYVVNGDDVWLNHVQYYSDLEDVKYVLEKLLLDYELTFKDGEPDENGDLFWNLDNGNGYYASVMFFLDPEGSANLDIYTFVPEEE